MMRIIDSMMQKSDFCTHNQNKNFCSAPCQFKGTDSSKQHSDFFGNDAFMQYFPKGSWKHSMEGSCKDSVESCNSVKDYMHSRIGSPFDVRVHSPNGKCYRKLDTLTSEMVLTMYDKPYEQMAKELDVSISTLKTFIYKTPDLKTTIFALRKRHGKKYASRLQYKPL